MSPHHRLISLLDASAIEFTTEHHDAIQSSEQTSHDRGMDLHAGAKAIVTVGDKTGTHYLFVLPADYKLDNAKTKEAVGEKIGFAPDTAEVTECVPGSVPPFGSLFQLKTFCDPRLGENEIIFFNAGTLTDTIKMRYQDYIAIEKPVVMEIGKLPAIIE